MMTDDDDRDHDHDVGKSGKTHLESDLETSILAFNSVKTHAYSLG